MNLSGAPLAWRRSLAAALLGLAACSRLSGGSGPPSVGSPDLPPLDDAPPATTPSLTSAVAGDGVARLGVNLGDGARPLGLFAALDVEELFDGPPALAEVTSSHAQLDGLANQQTLWLSLAFTDAPEPEPTGSVVSVRPGPPVYVDIAASPIGADGKTPETAYPDLLLGLLDGLVAGGANIWMAGGDYGGVAAPLYAGIHLAGGFAPGFDLTERDPAKHPTILRGVAEKVILNAQAGAAACSVDGLELSGDGVAKRGLVGSGPPLAVRDTRITNCTAAGIRLAGGSGDPVTYDLIGVTTSGHGGEGLALDGAVRLEARACRFDGNVQEGFDADDQLGPDAETVRIALFECRAAGNGSEGIDIDLVAPLGGGTHGALHEVLLSGCRVELNGTDGVLLDADAEATPGWIVQIDVIGLTSRANGRAGLHLDLDGEAFAAVRDTLCIANAEEGLLITSDPFPAVAAVTASAFLGNGGAGVRAAEGDASVFVSHSAFAANGGTALTSEHVTGSSLSNVFWLPEPGEAEAGVRSRHAVVAADPFDPALARLPLGAVTITQVDEQGVAPAGSPTPPAVGDLVELAGDGVARSFVGLGAGGRWQLDPAPSATLLPARLLLFGADTDISPDYRAVPAGPADDAGLPPPGAPPIDAGPVGSDSAAWPGRHVADAGPSLAPRGQLPGTDGPVASTDELNVHFGVDLDRATASALSVVAFGPGGALSSENALALEDALFVASSTGWPAQVDLVLHPLLADVSGRPMVGPLLIPFGSDP